MPKLPPPIAAATRRISTARRVLIEVRALGLIALLVILVVVAGTRALKGRASRADSAPSAAPERAEELSQAPVADRPVREFQQAYRELDEQVGKFLQRLEPSQSAEEMAELRVLRRVYGVSSFLHELDGWLESRRRRKLLSAEIQQEFDRLVQQNRALEQWTVTISQTGVSR